MKRNYISPLTENILLTGEVTMLDIQTGSGSTFDDKEEIS